MNVGSSFKWEGNGSESEFGMSEMSKAKHGESLQ